MAQRKPSNKRIESRADRAAYTKTGDTPEEFEPYKAGFIHGAIWYRDHDPWFYVEDGELPELEGSSGRYAVSDDVWAWIVSHGQPCIMDYHWDKNEGHYWEDDEGDKYKWDAVICWMPIPQPQK